MESLESQFGLSAKISEEPETAEIIKQLFERVFAAYPGLALLKGKRILDIACGSRTSSAPAQGRFGPLRRRGSTHRPQEGYTALFEPWFCRILSVVGANPVGIDKGDLDGEPFEHYPADLGRIGALDFLPQHSFDAVHDSRLFGSPEFTNQFPDRTDALCIAREIVDQERRVLKDGGIILHSDAHRLIGA
jgi:SAM-dependent methyltransferase